MIVAIRSILQKLAKRSSLALMLVGLMALLVAPLAGASANDDHGSASPSHHAAGESAQHGDCDTHLDPDAADGAPHAAGCCHLSCQTAAAFTLGPLGDGQPIELTARGTTPGPASDRIPRGVSSDPPLDPPRA